MRTALGNAPPGPGDSKEIARCRSTGSCSRHGLLLNCNRHKLPRPDGPAVCSLGGLAGGLTLT